jgi:hypothetical protein
MGGTLGAKLGEMLIINAVGAKVVFADGLIVGLTVGFEEGLADGLPVGFIVGVEELAVGCLVGDLVHGGS